MRCASLPSPSDRKAIQEESERTVFQWTLGHLLHSSARQGIIRRRSAEATNGAYIVNNYKNAQPFEELANSLVSVEQSTSIKSSGGRLRRNLAESPNASSLHSVETGRVFLEGSGADGFFSILLHADCPRRVCTEGAALGDLIQGIPSADFRHRRLIVRREQQHNSRIGQAPLVREADPFE